MSHELENAQSMVWTSQVPWHGLGIELDPEAGAKAWMKAAGLDWTVSKEPMFVTLPDGSMSTVKGKKGSDYSVLLRHKKSGFDESDIFGPVGPEWIPVQNHEVFSFVQKFCEAGHMTMETCGSLKGGTEIWALCKFSDTFEPIKGDPMNGYLLFHSAHVWGKGNQVRLTPIRVVCNNTLTMAIGSKGSSVFRLPHIKAFDEEVQIAATQALGLATEKLDDFKETVAFLSKAVAKPDQVEEFITELYQPQLLADRKIDSSIILSNNWTPTSENVYEAISLAPGADLKGSKGSWWGALNGVTYVEDHMRVSFQDQSNVLASAWFGGGAKKKLDAMALAMSYAKEA